MNVLNNEVQFMGVINLTPDSFSENLKTIKLEEQLQQFKDFDIIDFGAESTSPQAKAISSSEEIQRYSAILDQIDLSPFSSLSIDTYKKDTFLWVYKKIKQLKPEVHLIWNDISGKLDKDFYDVVEEIGTQFTYIMGHNLAPSRSESSQHQSFTSLSLHLDQLKYYFESAHQTLSAIKLPFYFDPLPGFSKKREHNHYLVKEFDQLVNCFDCPFVFAISRKSFLRFPPEMDIKLESNKKKTDELQALLSFHLLTKLKDKKIIFRTHDDSLYYSLKNYSNII